MTPADSVRPLVSLIFPAYNEVENAPAMLDFYREIVANHPDYAFEMIVVDDGSSDGTGTALASATHADEPVRVIELSRNFGSHAAVTAGLTYAEGDAAITLSADRQEPLEAIGLFLDQWRAGAELVWGLREVRVQQHGLDAVFSQIFSSAFRSTSELANYPIEGPSQILLTRRVIDTLNSLPEGNRNVLALAGWTGFEQRSVSYQQLPRPHGKSKWTFQMKLKMAMDSFVEFSQSPLKWMSGTGLILAGAAVVLLVVAAILALTGHDGAATTTICGTVLLVGGINLVGMGVLGEYIWRSGADARRRPVFIVRRVLSNQLDTE